ncbi:HAD family hydrolase [Candidatus Thorarchaeota archaeon]|nr:MAG: HAD family hydrolase [Candidatus Thorarchaeota archaeon]
MSLEDKKLWLFDVDNTLIHDVENPKPFSDSQKLWKHLNEKGKELAVLTNVGRLSAKQVNVILVEAGYDLSLDRTLTAGTAAAGYIISRNPDGRCFLISEGGARDDFVHYGVKLAHNPPIDYVAIGADRGLTYQHLNFAAKMVRSGAALICISGSRDYPGEFLGHRDEFLGERSIVAAIEDATGVEATIVGKPMPEIVRESIMLLGFEKEDVVLVGDNPASDVAGGNAAGLTTVLVNRPDNIVSFDARNLDMEPDYAVDSLEEIIPMV